MTVIVTIEAVVIVLLAVLVAGLLRSHAEILRRLHALGAGEDLDGTVELGPTRRSFDPSPKVLSEVPSAALVGITPAGVTSSVALSGSRGYTLLAFLSSGCGTCKAFWKALAEGASLDRDIRTVVVTRSAVDESLSDIRRLAPAAVLTVMSSDAWDDFAVPYTPYFVLVDAARGAVVGDGAAAGWPQLVGLVERALGDSSPERRSTTERLTDTDEELRRAGILPGDPVLYRRPIDP
jgi:hypothetical protein